MNSNRPHRVNRPSRFLSFGASGIENEQVLALVFESISWDIKTICVISSVSRRFRAIARRVLWRLLCVHRAPGMAAALSGADLSGRIDGGWNSLAKLMFYCGGGESTRSPGHFASESRFSKTSGRFFLPKSCRGDLLYVSDVCEHRGVGCGDEHLGVFRGVFREFMKSKTWQCLVRRQAELEVKFRCSYCGGRVWSMKAARLVPKSAARRLGSRDGGLEFFVCVNGHVHGTCWLIPLSSEEEDESVVFSGEEEDDSEDLCWL
ncbi:hypothetical protein HA466_0060660 [Hirschfeldia incana]|nr:hypothetical protein HA466_0060660 [Hirschfeldia incana]